MPAFFFTTDRYIEGLVMANYTNGAPVNGNLTLKATVRPIRPINPRRFDSRPYDPRNPYANTAGYDPSNPYQRTGQQAPDVYDNIPGFDRPIEKYFNFVSTFGDDVDGGSFDCVFLFL